MAHSAQPEDVPQREALYELMITHTFLSNPSWHIQEILTMFATCCVLNVLVIPRISRYLVPGWRASMRPYTAKQWDVRIVSLVCSVFICIMALWVIVNDEERAQMTDVHGRIWGYSKNVGALSGYVIGYHLWDSILVIQNTRTRGRDMLLHSVCTLILLSACYRPFIQFYSPWHMLYHISTPFLHIHWFCDILEITGSTVQLVNGLVLLFAFFWSRIVCGIYQSLGMYKDLWSAHFNNYSSKLLDPGLMHREHAMSSNVNPIGLMDIANHTAHPPLWLSMSTFFAAVALNILNCWWFYRLIHSISRRFALAKSHGGSGLDGALKKLGPDKASELKFGWPLKVFTNLLPWCAGLASTGIYIISLMAGTVGLVREIMYIRLYTMAGKLTMELRSDPIATTTPLTQGEARMQRLWADVLEMDAHKIGPKDNFFCLGGDSVQAVMLKAAGQARGLRFTVADLFTASTLSDLSLLTTAVEEPIDSYLTPFELLSGCGNTDIIMNEAAITCAVHRDRIEDSYPCTPLQEALMALSIKSTGTYVARHLICLQSMLDMDRFRAAWQTVVASSPILRTRIVQPSSSQKMVQVVLRERPSWELGSDLPAYLEEDRQLTMNFGEPLNRCAVIKDVDSAKRYLVWTMHHAIYDGWSLSLIIRDIVRVYEGAMIPSPPKFNHFVKYSVDANRDAERAFWKAQLAGSQPSRFPKVPEAKYEVKVDSSYSRLIRVSPASKTDCTTPTVIRGAWALLMGMYENTSNVVIGVTLSGRNAPMFGIEDVLGPTITTMPVCIDVHHDQTISKYLHALQKQSTAMIPFEQYGMRNIKGIDADTQLACTFQNLLITHPTTWSKDICSIGTVEEHSMDFANDKTYPLVMECTLTANGIQITASFDSELLFRHQVIKVVGQFEHVVQQICSKDGATLIDDVDMISEEDRRDIRAWNSTCPTALDTCVHEDVARQTAARPDAPAVCGWDTSFNYRELDRLSTRLARHLVTLGVGPEMFVPLCFEKSAWTVVAMLGVLKAGGACASVDPRHPVDRLRTMIADLGAGIVLASSANAGLLSGVADTIVVVNASLDDQEGLNLSPHGQRRKVRSCDAAFVVFTSGSTGKPKGIVLEHVAFCTSVWERGGAMRLGVDTRVLQFAAYTFDVSLEEIFGTLMHGGCVCVPSEEQRVNGLADVIQRMNVNWACLTPSVASLLLPAEVPTLKVLAISGEAATRGVIVRWADAVHLINVYGPAECSIWSTHLGGLGRDTSPANIGRGIGSVSWVVDATNHERLVPIGCVGELLIEGPILARGYLNDRDKTAVAFIENSDWSGHFGSCRQRRFYKTGDLVRYDLDGTLNFVGRRDTQVKLHGQRLELGEVEHHLLSDRQLANAMATVPVRGYGQERLVAVIVFRESAFGPRPGLESTSRTLYGGDLRLVDESREKIVEGQMSRIREHLSSQLPAYMVPVLWMVVDTMPLTASGKLDRARVRRWVEDMDEQTHRRSINEEAQGLERPMTSMHRRLRGVLAQVLDLPEERVALNRSFLSLGGDSITAMQVVTRARAKGITVRVQDILQSRTILQLTLVLKSSKRTSLWEEDELDVVFDVSPIQQMYFELEGRVANQFNHHFNQSFLLRLKREVPTQDLARAVEVVVRQHSMLRARFKRTGNGRWGQLVSRDVAGSYRFTAHDVAGQAEVTAIVADIQVGLDIENGPVFAGATFNVPGKGQLLFLVAHHLVVDLVSWRVILHDIEEILESGILSAEAPLPFQAWCRSQAEYASQHLASENVLPFDVAPADYAYWGMVDRTNMYSDAVHESFTLDVGVTTMLLGVCNTALGTEPVEIFLATLIHAFGQIFVDRAVPTVFSEGHGREPWDPDIDLSGTVGWFTTMGPLHVPVLAGMDVVDIVRRTKGIRRTLPGNGWPYFTSRFLNAHSISAFGDHMPMEVLFNYLGRSQQLERDDGLLRLEPRPAEVTVLDVGCDVQRLALLEISAVVRQGSAHFEFVYNRNMQRQLDVVRWMRAWEQSLRAATRLLSDMDVASAMTDERMPTVGEYPLLPPSIDRTNFQGLFTAIRSRLPGQSAEAIEDIFPCTHVQSMMLESINDDPIMYRVSNIFKIVDIYGDVDLERLKRAWNAVLTSHAALRTFFAAYNSKDGTQYLQVVLRKYCPNINIVNTQSGVQALELLKAIQPSLSTPFDGGPPYQLTLAQCKERGIVWSRLDICHAILDAISLQIVQCEVKVLYDLDNIPQLLPGSSFLPFVKANLSGESPSTSHYWTEYLKGSHQTIVRSLQLSSSHSVVESKQSQRNLRSHSTVSIYVTDVPLLRASCQNHNATIANLVNASWSIVLHQHLVGQPDICFGYLVSARDLAFIPGVENAVGPHLNLLLQRVFIDENTTLINVLQDVAKDSAISFTHQGRGGDAEYLPRDTKPRLFNTIVNYRKFSARRIARKSDSNFRRQTSSLSFENIEYSDPWNFDIVAEIADDEESMTIDLVHWTDVVDTEVVKHMAEALNGLVRQIVRSPNLTVAEALFALES